MVWFVYGYQAMRKEFPDLPREFGKKWENMHSVYRRIKKGDVVISCNRGEFRWTPKGTINVDVSHGVLLEKSDGRYGGDTEYIRKLKVHTFCAFSRYDKKLVEKKRFPFKNIHITGRKYLDDVYRLRHSAPRYDVLYAPTWNTVYNGKREQDIIDALGRSGLKVLVTLHPLSMTRHERIRFPRSVEFVKEADKDDFGAIIASARSVVTDYSSICYYFFALGRPVIFHNSFAWRNEGKDPWSWVYMDEPKFGAREYAYTFTAPYQVSSLVKMALKDSTAHRLSKEFGREVCGEVFDGKCYRRVRSVVNDVIEEYA